MGLSCLSELKQNLGQLQHGPWILTLHSPKVVFQSVCFQQLPYFGGETISKLSQFPISKSFKNCNMLLRKKHTQNFSNLQVSCQPLTADFLEGDFWTPPAGGLPFSLQIHLEINKLMAGTPSHEDLDDDFSFSKGGFSGSMLVIQGVTPVFLHRKVMLKIYLYVWLPAVSFTSLM